MSLGGESRPYYSGDMMFTPSKMQQAIFDFIQANPQTNLMIKATAGSGKTKTVEECIKILLEGNQNLRILYLVFNKKNQVEAASKFQYLGPGIQALTLNSFGHRVCSQWLGRAQVEAEKTAIIYKFYTCHFDKITQAERNKAMKLLSPTVRLVSLFKGHCCFTVQQAMDRYEELVDKHDIEIPEKSEELFKSNLFTTYAECLSNLDMRDFDDQIFAPVAKDLPFERYDYVFVDECQDLNPCKIQLVKKLDDVGSTIIVVGDECQAIYGFAGADVEAMRYLSEVLNCHQLPLSVNYRCSNAVVREANRLFVSPEIINSRENWRESTLKDVDFTPHIIAHDGAPEGLVGQMDYKDFVEKSIEGDFVLCRTTAPLISGCMHFIRKGKKAVVLGRDIGKGLTDVINNLGPSSMDIEEALIQLTGWYDELSSKYRKAGRSAMLQSVEDKYETLRVLFESAKTLKDVLNTIDKIFSDTACGVTFSTGHKAKGLEATHVFVLRPDLLPHPNAKQEWQQIQEKNLKFVIITRAKVELYWVNGSEPTGKISSKDVNNANKSETSKEEATTA